MKDAGSLRRGAFFQKRISRISIHSAEIRGAHGISHKWVFVFATGFGPSEPGKSIMHVSAFSVFFDDLIHHRPEKAILFLTNLIIAVLEWLCKIFRKGELKGYWWRWCGHIGSHDQPFAREEITLHDVSSRSLSFGHNGLWRMVGKDE
jgi:hypothetical protein